MRRVIFNHFIFPIFLLIVLFCAVAMSEECKKDEIICGIVCQQDGDDLGVIIDNKCYCGNYRDVSKIVFKINSSIKTSQIKKTWSWE